MSISVEVYISIVLDVLYIVSALYIHCIPGKNTTFLKIATMKKLQHNHPYQGQNTFYHAIYKLYQAPCFT